MSKSPGKFPMTSQHFFHKAHPGEVKSLQDLCEGGAAYRSMEEPKAAGLQSLHHA